MAKIFDSKDALLAATGTQLGETEWTQITQERVNQFAGVAQLKRSNAALKAVMLGDRK